MEINKLNFEKIKSAEINFSFEDLDVDGDGVINKKDKDLTQNTQIFNMITHLLNSTDEEDEFELVDDFDYKNAMKSGNNSAQCLDGNCQFTVPTKTANENAATANLNNLASTNDCPDGSCVFSAATSTNTVTSPSASSTRVTNADGTYTETTTNANGATVAITYNSAGKRISAKTTNADGSVNTSTYKYNDNGSYTVTTKYSDKTRTTKYNSAGKKVSYTDKYKNGTTKVATFKYNSSGSYSVTIKDKKKKTSSIKKYNAKGKLTSSISKNSKGKTTKKTSYTYNADGSYTQTVQNYSSYHNEGVKVTKFDANGKKIKIGTSTNAVVEADSSNYQNTLNQNGVTFVLFSSHNCGHCDTIRACLKPILPALDGIANFAEINLYDSEGNRDKNNGDLGWSFVKKFMGNVDVIGLPFVVKFVNGKPTGVVRFTEAGSAKLLDQIKKLCSKAKTK